MKISFKWVGGATWIMGIDTLRIACDPVLCPEGHVQDYRYFKTKRLNTPHYDASDFRDIDLWLLTHNHEDHIDRYGLQRIEKNSTIVSHTSLQPIFSKKEFIEVRYLNWHESTSLSKLNLQIKITALPAIHAKKSMMSKFIGNGNGYLVEISKKGSQYTVYITGDSVYNRSIKNYFSDRNVDLIIANAGSAMVGKSLISKIIGRITNNISDVIKINRDIGPRVLIPVHWGTFTHYSEKIAPGSFKSHGNIKVIDPGEKIVIT